MYMKLMKCSINKCVILTLLFGSILLVVLCFDSFARHEGDIRVNFLAQGSSKCSQVELIARRDCLPLDEVNERLCLDVGCCWDKNFLGSSIPPCYFSKGIVRYEVTDVNKTSLGIGASLRLASRSGLPANVQHLKVNVSFCGKSLLRIKIVNAVNNGRYEVPLSLETNSCSSITEDMLYTADIFTNGSLVIQRKTTYAKIFHADLHTLLYADQLLQISLSLPSHLIYGLGDHMGSLLRDMNWTKYIFFNRDQIPEKNWNLYSSFPFYMALEDDGSCHGVYLFNSNALDVILQPQPAVTFRTIGGILDLFVFLGPSPNRVIQQFTKLVGYPTMPPYWSLGFHLSRLGYFTLNKTIEVFKRTIKAGIPFDVQWNDIDFMDKYNDFTYDRENFNGLPEFVDKLHDMGMHYVIITDPGISSAEKPGTYQPFDEGLALDLFIKNSSGQLLQTKVWNMVSSVFPDFTHPSASSYWKTQLSIFHNILKFDGVWLDMNEPTNFLNGSFEGCPEQSSLEYPPYTPGNDALCTKTLCMTAQYFQGIHYNLHNIYGFLETKATYNAMADIRSKRPFILTRAGFPGIGKFGAMWNGDMISVWEHMRKSIPSMLTFSMAGIPHIGVDICGFNDNTTVELCARWFTLGAFYPFCRNHNSDENIAQDPVALGPIVIAAAKTALTVRYSLLPYLYTLMFFSHSYGGTVARPLFFEFPLDSNSYHCDTQFLWGPALMIVPALEPGIVTVSGYLPPDLWYDFYTGEQLVSTGENFTMDAPLNKINLFVRGGYVLPCQEPNTTTTLSRGNEFFLIIALDMAGAATGSLYWDDGDSLDIDLTKEYNLVSFDIKENRFHSSHLHIGYPTNMILGNITIFGVKQAPENVLVNGRNSSFHYQSKFSVLRIVDLGVTLMKPIVAEW